ncbi:YraN family protein [Pelagibacterium luteolum]|uniref:UPF0102 protein SAMN04487974_101558 n=1 Tax=Pelagibacterium luteolum TaxID=440168 RepID=A0A1G7SKE3_9HYPH|nr:YraN family protein [Pelagibacterium luteolum]SDG23344.1 putative endonuclease [Pelagibacterium luteolum]
MRPSSASNSPDPRRRAERAGRRAETLALWYLRLKGYRILKTRYKSPVGEIDIVARRKTMIVMVEVKHRSRADQLGLADALGAVDTRRIVRCTEWFQSQHPAYHHFDFRFDVIAIAPGRWPYHLINAFSA